MEIKGSKTRANIAAIIAVTSGKGGVGKSTVATNLAYVLHARNYKVGLLDADLYGPSIPTLVGLVAQPRIEILEGVEILVPSQSQGVKILSMGSLVESHEALAWRGPMLHQTIKQFFHRTAWGELDFLIVDMPPGTGDISLTLAQTVAVSGSVVVTTPQLISSIDVRRALTMWRQLRIPILGIVENMAAFECDGCGKIHKLFSGRAGEELAHDFQTALIAQLPMQAGLADHADHGMVWVLREPGSILSQSFETMTSRLLDRLDHLKSQQKTPEIRTSFTSPPEA